MSYFATRVRLGGLVGSAVSKSAGSGAIRGSAVSYSRARVVETVKPVGRRSYSGWSGSNFGSGSQQQAGWGYKAVAAGLAATALALVALQPIAFAEDNHTIEHQIAERSKEPEDRSEEADADVVENSESGKRGQDEEGQGEVEGEKKSSDAQTFKYVIIGGGTAGYAALRYMLRADGDAKILFVGAEPHAPYNRPPLSKNLWKSEDPDVAQNLQYKDWEGNSQNIFFEDDDEFFKNKRVTYIKDNKVVDLDVFTKALLLSDGTIVEYTKCLVATGGTPRVLPVAQGKPNVSTFRTIEDFQKLDAIARDVKHITIVGGGFLGSELAWGVSKRGVKVTQVFPEPGVLATTLPQYLSDFMTEKAKDAGIDVHAESLVDDITQSGDTMIVTLNNGKTIDTDHIVVAAGLVPTTDFASLDLEIDPANGGILVNSELSARTGLYAAGDVASYYDKTFGVRRRVEHYDHALATGRLAAENMIYDTNKSYLYQPMFWSDLGEYGFEAVGMTDSKLPTVSVWEKPEDGSTNDFKRGVVYYLRDDVVVGVMTWGLFGKLDAARVLLRKKTKVDNYEDLKNAISLEHDDH